MKKKLDKDQLELIKELLLLPYGVSINTIPTLNGGHTIWVTMEDDNSGASVLLDIHDGKMYEDDWDTPIKEALEFVKDYEKKKKEEEKASSEQKEKTDDATSSNKNDRKSSEVKS